MPSKAGERWLLPVIVDRPTASSILPKEACCLDGRTIRSPVVAQTSQLYCSSNSYKPSSLSRRPHDSMKSPDQSPRRCRLATPSNPT